MESLSTRLSLVALLSLAAPAVSLGQTGQAVVVSDDRGQRVPFAFVRLVGGVSTVADDSGRAWFRLPKRDSVRVQVRRIGYREFMGWARREGEAFPVTIPALVQRVQAVEVTARRDETPLERTGFYDRVERARRGAYVAEFITPEELDFRNASLVSRVLDGRRSVRVKNWGGRPALTGRGGCAMTIIVDGQQLKGTIEETIVEEAPQSISRGRSGGFSGGGGPPMTVDDAVNGLAVMAVEIYASTANAPVELQTLGGRGSCGIVAIWTGPRQ